MKKKGLAIVLYSILGLIELVFVFFAIAGVSDAQFVIDLQKSVIRNTSWTTFDVFTIAEWGIVIDTVILAALLVIFDEVNYRRKNRAGK